MLNLEEVRQVAVLSVGRQTTYTVFGQNAVPSVVEAAIVRLPCY